MKKEIEFKLFSEFVINEYDLSNIISDYVFHHGYYERELRRIGITNFPKDRDAFSELVAKHKDKIKFRTKNIIFVGYSNKVHNRYYFLQLTTKKKENCKHCKQLLYFKHIIKGYSVYINLNKVYYFNFNEQNVWLSKFNNNKLLIKQDKRWKANLLNALPRKIIKSLSKRTNLEIYNTKIDEYNILDSLDF